MSTHDTFVYFLLSSIPRHPVASCFLSSLLSCCARICMGHPFSIEQHGHCHHLTFFLCLNSNADRSLVLCAPIIFRTIMALQYHSFGHRYSHQTTFCRMALCSPRFARHRLDVPPFQARSHASGTPSPQCSPASSNIVGNGLVEFGWAC